MKLPHRLRALGVFILSFGVVACQPADKAPEPAPPAPDTAMKSEPAPSKAAPEEWLSHGRTADEQRFSPLELVNDGNVGDLGLAWYFDIPTKRGIEATPLISDGVMYTTGSWSIVYALDARTGESLWTYDPRVPREWARYGCCDAVNRGVALWEGKVYVGTLDGYLVALDAATGEEVWRVDTIDRTPPYTITGAPRVVKGKVVIGNGGAEMGVRGYVSAYDAATGELAWRFHTVPGNPDDGFESDTMAMAAETWTGEWWRYGGGGTVWDSMAYDPALDLLYIGVGNGSPWNQKIRSPGGGDNLFLSSIVALDPDDGSYAWHYQTTPGETWDYTATQHIILADIDIGGDTRKVLMQAPKNGFFYVLDRENGELVSANNYVTVNWATGIDGETGRPIEAENARYTEGPRVAFPGPLGGHNWHPMAFSPKTGLVYLPSQQIPFVYADESGFEAHEGVWNTGVDLEVSAFPDDPAAAQEVRALLQGQLSAWDPVTQSEVWRYEHAGPWNGGVLATAGNLVFQGSLIGEFSAFRASDGERLWTFPAQTGVAAAPVTYSLDGEQYVTVMAGWGTVLAMVGGPVVGEIGLKNRSRVLTFKLGGDAVLPAVPQAVVASVPELPDIDLNPEDVAKGKRWYSARCSVCHGDVAVSGGVIPDLRYASPGSHAAWNAIVLDGALRTRGMPSFRGILNEEQSAEIQAYVVSRARLLTATAP